MADNINVSEGSGKTIAADEISGALHQRVKISQGADGSATDVSSAAPLQVTLANTGANSNKLLVTPDLPSGAATAAHQVTQNTAQAAIQAAVEALDNAVGSNAGGVTTGGLMAAGYDGAATRFLNTDSSGRLLIGAGTLAIGKLAANSGVDIGDVDITSIAAGDNNIGNVDIASAIPTGTNNIGDVDIASIAAGDNNIGNVDVVTMPVVAVTQSGTWDEVGINDSGNSITVDGTVAVTGVSTLAEQQSQTTHLATIAGDTTDIEAAVEIMDDWDNAASDGASVSGDVAHDAADAGEPVKIGYKAIAHGTNPTAVTANDRTNGYANRHGVPFVIGGHPNPVNKHINVTDADGAQTDTALVTVSAGTKIVVTCIQVTADGANTGDVGYRLGFGTANTPSNDAAAGMLSSHPGVKAGGGLVVGNGGGIIGVGADNEDLRLTCEDPAGGSLDVTVTYYTIES